MAEKEEIVPGKNVELKSGGSTMTTGSFDAYGKAIKCYWFDHNNVFHEQYIDKQALVVVSEK